MGIGYRIKEARERLGLTQTELGEMVGVTGSAITNYEKETSHPKEQIIYKLMETLKVDANYLFQDAVKLPKVKNDITLAEYEYIKKYRTLDPYGKEIIDFVLTKEAERVAEMKASLEHSNAIEFQPIPSSQKTRTLNYYQRLASAGTGQLVFDDVPVDLIEIPDIPEYRKVKYAIGVNGQSMEPLYYDGDILLVEPRKEIDIGEIGIFIVDGDSFVKKLGRNMLISVNEDYSDIPITEETHCLGLVVDKISSMPEEIPKETKKMPELSEIDIAALEEGAKLMRKEKIHKREA